MAHFAQLDANNTVKTIIVVNNSVIDDLPFPQSENVGIEFCQTLYGNNTVWKQTSYNNNFRKHYASIGFTYDTTLDAFVPPKPYKSWVLDANTNWTAPIPYPTGNNIYKWDEANTSWDLLILSNTSNTITK